MTYPHDHRGVAECSRAGLGFDPVDVGGAAPGDQLGADAGRPVIGSDVKQFGFRGKAFVDD
ncbi:Uncharacterised protein [Mycobacterium tuberculosis]|uniref:Uncharacterized protein n=1 Tax=Mycobacterium tuberculosis TaxID=1773 RepID=A0A655J420_MYCTX|nr:Uncharacterised protein [Mycobacterium tuberculosis]CKS51966.1 Uncharacterised protein [Mycobacterium tuberculosis]CKT93298.1 Uncharacterised protein [Mycobacterium tuberculosis]COW42013.1 Uncharacterised protein [Mycobacterium tuberculosis]